MKGEHALHCATLWIAKSHHNTQKWGQQNLKTLCVVAQEELGEIAQAILDAEHSGGDPQRIPEEIADCAAVMFQLLDAWHAEYGSK